MKLIKDILKPKGLLVGGKKSHLIRRYLSPRKRDYNKRKRRGKKRKVKTKTQKYHSYLVKFMNWKVKPTINYDESTKFTEDKLLTILPKDVAKFLNLKAFGKEEPGEY